MHTDLTRIGLAIAAARRAAGQSQSALADSLGMSRSTISGIENGTVIEIGVRKVIALCQALGLELVAQPAGRRPTLPQLRAESQGNAPGA